MKLCKVCGQPTKREMCTECEANVNCRATMAEIGLVECINLDSPINYMPVSKEA